MEKLVIDRSKVNPHSFDYKAGDCCYIGRYAEHLNEPSNNKSVSLWADDQLGIILANSISEACFRSDEKAAIRLFARVGVEVEFV